MYSNGCLPSFTINYNVYHQPSRFIGAGVSAKPFTLSLSAVFKKAGSCSCETLTSPAYINSRMACRWLYETSFSIIIGCFDGFSWWKKNKQQLWWHTNTLYCIYFCIPQAMIWSKDCTPTEPFYVLCMFAPHKPMSP